MSPQNDIVISQGEVEVLFKKTNKSKAPGPDAIGRCILHPVPYNCVVFLHIFFNYALTAVNFQQLGNPLL